MITYERKKVRYFQQLAESFDSAAANMEILDKIHQVLLHERSEAEINLANLQKENYKQLTVASNKREKDLFYFRYKSEFNLADKILKLHWEVK